MTKLKVTRRGFMRAAGSAAALTILPSRAFKGATPSGKLNVAGIGIGGMGAGNLRNLESENIVALCDVDHRYAAGAIKRYSKAKLFKDFREMLAEVKDLDAVMIATPDHTHAAIAMAAIRAGKHVFCQKPLTHDIHEARVLRRAARRYGVATQMGIQGHSQEGLRLICEWIWDGAIGEVREVDAWCSLSYHPHGHVWWSSPLSERPAEGQPVPEGLDWDTWIGPAPMRPYHSGYHPKVWRCWWDFGCGMMGDRGAHTLDSVFSALKLGYAESVEATCEGGNAEVHPARAEVTYQFPAREGFPPLTLRWYEGREPPRPDGLEKDRRFPREGGVLFRGEKGIIMCGVYGNSPRLVPESLMKAYKRPAKTLPRIRGSHEQDWLRACKGGPAAGAAFDYSGPLTELTLLGNVAKRFQGNLLKWNGPNMRVTNHAEANTWVRRPRRDGWALV